MVFYKGQGRSPEFYSREEIGKEDGQSIVEVKQVKAVCNQCGETYDDKESIEMVRKWVEEGYAPCPNISCHGQMELKGV
ncbi:unnamed protein product [marine sediment metagenome]|uniref:Uncharacterized protein n=1 Tax=marine sediment metagenome TaxID=412755 RepID=X1GCJ1_9ZZZZ